MERRTAAIKKQERPLAEWLKPATVLLNSMKFPPHRANSLLNWLKKVTHPQTKAQDQITSGQHFSNQQGVQLEFDLPLTSTVEQRRLKRLPLHHSLPRSASAQHSAMEHTPAAQPDLLPS
jgi:hypothetical protein